MKRLKLLCVDDDAGMRELYQSMFASHGYDVLLAASPRQALELLRSRNAGIDAIISDYEMPEMNGAELAAVVKRSHRRLPFIMISGSPRDLEQTANVVDATIPKGWPVSQLMDQVAKVVASCRTPRLADYLSLGSALAGAASVAFLLSRLLITRA